MQSRLLLPLIVLAARPIPFEQQGKWGYKDGGTVVIRPRFETAGEFSAEGIAAVVDEKGWAYIDTKGRLLLRPYVFDNGPDYFQEGLARFTAGAKIGFFDRHGRVVIAPKFTFALPFSDGLAAVCDACRAVPEGEHSAFQGGRWGFIDRRGAAVIPLQFEEVEPFQHGRTRVKSQGKWKWIDRKGATWSPRP